MMECPDGKKGQDAKMLCHVDKAHRSSAGCTDAYQ